MNIAGYLINKPDGLVGVRGEAYSYVLAGNGLWIESENRFMAARIPVAECDVRGLAPLETAFVLRHGLIPQHLWDLTLNYFIAHRYQERYLGVSWIDHYRLYYANQIGEEDQVEYQVGENIVADLHSHGTMQPLFSPRDNSDEQGFKIYAVCGNLHEYPVVRLRIGIYGYFHEIKWTQVFHGSLSGVVDFAVMEMMRRSLENR